MKCRLCIVLIFLLFVALFFSSCEEEKTIVDGLLTFEIQEVHLPEVLSANSKHPYLVSAKVLHPEGSEGIRYVRLILKDKEGTEFLVELYDDGGVEHPSGDFIAFDNIYSGKISVKDLGIDLGNYSAYFEAKSVSDEIIQTSDQDLKVLNNRPPQILDFTLPDSIQPGMAPTLFSFTVQDSDGIEDVRWVILKGFIPGEQFPAFSDTLLPPDNKSPVFNFQIDSAYGAGKKGDYDVHIIVEDLVGSKSPEVVHRLHVVNTPPEIWSAVVPDTLKVPDSGTVSLLITVRVNDRQSLLDIADVYFDSFKSDGSPSSGNPFHMYDNGLPYNPNNPVSVGDQVAGDGTYSLTIFLSSKTPTGTYTFHFYARDKAGQLTPGPVDSIQVIQ